ncbi:MBL fold metallo-hydrolase [Gemmatimonas groenlandica]|uniref:MBL fold metallo-hydrolase n=1 Tax=Gemmatimonas groenlandica TaxID=2732249 RepID=A0A6M4IKJ7_9BACT|nr:MBL fold metallo-hydrolase [Gemmatimonas groenlandica]QJR35160.1 MBL fold metallo-hydrolase [Gemmatimonas groenlandica]
MLRITVLGSGSRGNAILIDGTDGAVLVDAGFGPRSLARRLKAVGRRPEEISALLLTHEHTDHASGAGVACTRWGWPMYGSAGTIEALGVASATDVSLRAGRTFTDDGPTSISGFLVETTSVPHDARDCRALVFTDIRSGARAGVAMDVGRVPEALPVSFERLDLIVVESNHDEQMLARGPYPWSLKQRISGGLGHLSNGAAAGFVSACAHRGLRGVLLTHLSETNNLPALAIERTRDALRRAGWSRDALSAASQHLPLPPMTSTGEAAWLVRASQLSLGF